MTGDGAARDERKCISRVAKVNAVPACYVGVWWQPIRCAACPPPLPLPTRRAGRGARRVRGSTQPSGGYAFEGRRRTAVASELGSCAQLVFPLIFPLFLLLLLNFISSPSFSQLSISKSVFVSSARVRRCGGPVEPTTAWCLAFVPIHHEISRHQLFAKFEFFNETKRMRPCDAPVDSDDFHLRHQLLLLRSSASKTFVLFAISTFVVHSRPNEPAIRSKT